MRNIPLGQVCKINPQKPARTDAELQCSFIPMEFIDDRFGIVTKQASRKIKEVDKGYTYFRDKDILFAKITPCMENGKCAIAKNLLNGIGFGSTEFHVIRVETDVVPEWVYYYLRQASIRKIAETCMTGSAGQKRVPSSFLEELLIPLPPLPEQKRIAAILEKADRLRRLRRYALELSGTYLQSVFLEMFGDPVTNPKGWDICSLRSISLKFSDGPFGSNLKTEHYTSLGIRVLRLQNIGIGQLIDDDKAYISETHFATLDKYRCIPGDIIVGTLGDPNLRACILPSSVPIALNKADCVQIRVNPDEAVAEYICWLLNLPHTLFLATGMIHGQTRDRINMGRLAELEVPIPDLTFQQKYAQIVQKYERLHSQQREAERQAEHLFQTLLHKAFRGEPTGDEMGMAALDEGGAHPHRQKETRMPEPIEAGVLQMALPLECPW